MSPDNTTGAVLITGASTGIGKATALRLHAAGRTVYATARRPDSLHELTNLGLHTLTLDVTDDASMQSAVAHIEEREGSVGALINNAGYGLYGPVEQVAMSEVQRQFDTNFFGLARLTQLVLPGMRAAGHGRVINVSSMGGRASLPGGAYYHATKYAVEAFSGALRLELAQFGLDVVVIEPGPVHTAWVDTATSSTPTNPDPSTADPYSAFKTAVNDSFAAVHSGPAARLASTAEDIATVITKAASARRPRTRYLINPVAKLFVTLNHLLPDRSYDAFVRAQYRLPR